MRDGTIESIRTLILADGGSREAADAVRGLLEDDGMVSTGVACRVLGVSRWTLRRMCERVGARRETRIGRGGSRVHLPSLRGVNVNAEVRAGR